MSDTHLDLLTPPDVSSDRLLLGRVALVGTNRVRGWIANTMDFSEHLSVRLIVDGVEHWSGLASEPNEELQIAGIGDGSFGFTVSLPTHVFDDGVHDVRVQETSTDWDVPGGLGPIRLSPLSLYEFGFVRIVDGEIVGYALDPHAIDRKLRVTILKDNVLDFHGVADGSLGDPGGPVASASYFRMPLHGGVLNSLMRGAGYALRIEDIDYPISVLTEFLQRQVQVRRDDSGQGDVQLSLTLKGLASQRISFDVFVNEEKQAGVFSDNRPGLSVRLERSLFRSARGSKVSVRFAGSGAEVSGSPIAIDTGTETNLFANSRFQEWEGGCPAHWKAEAAANVVTSQGGTSSDLALLVSTADGGSDGSLLVLSQEIDLRAAGPTDLEVVLVGRAPRGSRVKVVLVLDRHETREAQIELHPKQDVGFAKFDLSGHVFGDDTTSKVSFFLQPTESSPITLALAAVGGSGFRYDLDVRPADRADAETNAVVNGDFADWPAPFSRVLDNRITSAASGWSVVAPEKQAASVRLTELHASGRGAGEDPGIRYGLALRGPITGKHVRLEADLDVTQLLLSRPNRFSVFARPDHARERAQLDHVFVLARSTETASGDHRTHDALVLTLLRNVPLSGDGCTSDVVLTSAQANDLQRFARRASCDRSVRIVLVFEFHHRLNVVLGDVVLGHGTPSAAKAAAETRFVSLEDPNIIAQAGLVKGIGHWVSRHELKASSPGVQGDDHTHRPIDGQAAAWSWLPSDVASQVNIVVCVHNAVAETLDCLRSIRRHTRLPHTIVIVDDGSDASTRLQLERFAGDSPWIRMIATGENVGYTRSANLGVRSSLADWCVLLNSDTIVTPGWLEGLFGAVRARPDVAMVGPLSNAASWQSIPDLRDVNGRWKVNSLPQGWTVDEVAHLVRQESRKAYPEASLLNGFCTLIRRQAFEEVGGFDEVAFPVGYGEENDLCIRMRAQGYRCVIADDTYVFHAKSASFGSARRDALAKEGTRNLAAKHPAVDINELQNVMMEIGALAELRKVVRERVTPGHRVDDPSG